MTESLKNSVWQLLQDLSTKSGITEVVINNSKVVFVEREGRFIQLNVQLTKNDILAFIQEVASLNRKVCNAETPVLDGNLPDGSRINIIMEPYAKGCPAITIRKYLRHIKSFDATPDIFSLTPRWVELLKALVYSRCNIMVSGGTGVGKTTFLNLLLNEIAPAERVITIEDTLELSINLPNMVRLEARGSFDPKGKEVTIRDLVKNTLRMRPDRIIIGETRGGEIFDLLQAMNTGHEGSMSTIHANSTSECLSRFETLFMLAGYDVPYHVVRRQISSAIDFIIQLSRDREGNRIVSKISEITGVERDQILIQDIAVWEDDRLRSTGITAKRMQKIHRFGGLPLDFFNSKDF